MRNRYQINLRTIILLTMVSGATATISEKSNQHPKFNSPIQKENGRLLKPIIIPDLTAFADNSIPPQLDVSQKNKINELFDRDKRNEEEFQDSYVEKVVSRFSESPKFSSRYSAKPETDKITEEKADKSEDKDETEEKNDETGENTERPNLVDVLERSENERQLLKIIEDVVSENEKHMEYPDLSEKGYTSHFHSEDDEEHQPDIRSEINEPKEAEESEVTPTTSEPYPRLQSQTSFDDHADEYHETPSHQEDEEEEKRSANDYDDPPKNYHSVQTPLNEIKFRGPHNAKDNLERTRTRLPTPTKRGPAGYDWPYFEQRVKAEPEKFNEISEDQGYNKENTRDWTPETFQSRRLELDKAVEKDESRQTANPNHNFLTDKKKDKQSGLLEEEKKDHEGPLYQRIKQYKVVGKEAEHQSKQSFGEKPKQKLFSSPVTDSYPKFLAEEPKTKGKDLNVSQELETNSESHRFLKPATLNTKQKIYNQKLYSKSRQQQEIGSSFLKDLEDREQYDRENLEKAKEEKPITENDIFPPSFNHLEESEELYNIILANIQSVFGLRTKPLKSTTSRKSNAELRLEENRSLTWSLPSARKKTSEDKSEKPPIKRSDKVKTGSEKTTTFRTPAIPSDILKF